MTMKISHLAFAVCLAASTLSMAAEKSSEPTKSQREALLKCEGLKGDALDKCKREAAPGKSDDAASRAGGTSPGSSGDATSRTGVPASKADTTPSKGDTTLEKKAPPAQRKARRANSPGFDGCV